MFPLRTFTTMEEDKFDFVFWFQIICLSICFALTAAVLKQCIWSLKYDNILTGTSNDCKANHFASNARAD